MTLGSDDCLQENELCEGWVLFQVGQPGESGHFKEVTFEEKLNGTMEGAIQDACGGNELGVFEK